MVGIIATGVGRISKSGGRNEYWKNLKLPHIYYEQVVPETLYILLEFPAHLTLGNFQRIPHTL